MGRNILIISIFIILITCSKEDSELCNDSTSLYRFSDFPIGAAISAELLMRDSSYRKIVMTQFNRISGAEASLYIRVHPQKDFFNWADYDYLVNFCETYHKSFIGHSLVFYNYLPTWIEQFTGTDKEWEELLKNHIQTIVSRYKNKINSWIVVNEAFNEDGTLRNSIWKQHIGASYIAKSFIWAHEANPNAVLFYNDYGLELNGIKLDAVLTLLTSLKSDGVPIDGLGCQLHISDMFPETYEINDMAMKIQQNDLLVYYSEVDISLNTFKKYDKPTNEMFLRQKQKLKEIVLGYQQLDKKYQYGISFWNISDADTWIRKNFNRIDWPCMWDDNYRFKPMYCGIKEALLR